MLPSVQDGCFILPWSRCLWLVLWSWGVQPPLFTSLTYFWAVISKGLSCVPTLPSGPITACLINQACLSPLVSRSCHTLPGLPAPPGVPPACEAERGPQASSGPGQELLAPQSSCPECPGSQEASPKVSKDFSSGHPPSRLLEGGQACCSLQGTDSG